MTCPHKDITLCPLYHAAHLAGGFGCDDGRLGEDECAVARGMNYHAAVEAFRAHEPVLVAQLEWRQQAEEIKARRNRNMALNGIH